MQYDPKLKKAMEEIKAVLIKYDIAGVVVIHSPGHSEHLNHLTPSYSCAKPEGDFLRIRAKAEDFGGDTIKRNKTLKDTANMLHLLSDTTGRYCVLPIIKVSKLVDKLLDADNGDAGFTSHTTQNN